MAQKNPIKFLSLTIFLLVAIILLGMFSVSYFSGLVVIVGIIAYFLLDKLLKYIINRIPKNNPKIVSILVFQAVLIVIGIISIFFYDYKVQTCADCLPPCYISKYKIVATPESYQLNSIKIQEFIIIKDNGEFTAPNNWTATYVDSQSGFRLPEKTANIKNYGLLLKEVVIEPSVSCSDDVFVELSDFPQNSFYAAHYAKGIQKFPYTDTETITWSPESINVKFSYIAPPFQVISPALMPLMGATTTSQLVIGLISLLGTFIFTPIIKPIFAEVTQKYAQKKLSSLGNQPQQVVKLIISEKGDEKEIKIEKKR